jgi:hypothetical protein
MNDQEIDGYINYAADVYLRCSCPHCGEEFLAAHVDEIDCPNCNAQLCKKCLGSAIDSESGGACPHCICGIHITRDETPKYTARDVIGTCWSNAEIEEKLGIDIDDVEEHLEESNIERCFDCGWWYESGELIDEEGEDPTVYNEAKMAEKIECWGKELAVDPFFHLAANLVSGWIPAFNRISQNGLGEEVTQKEEQPH